MWTTLAAEPPADLLHRPLDWFVADHFRHRRLGALMHELASGEYFDEAQLRTLVGFLRHELGRHLAHEEEDLFPLLRKRKLPGDEIDEVLDRLTAEHLTDRLQADGLRAQLEPHLETRTAPGADPAVREALRAFASQELRHLALENAVVLPFARRRLTDGDLANLSRRMAARHGAELQTAR